MTQCACHMDKNMYARHQLSVMMLPQMFETDVLKHRIRSRTRRRQRLQTNEFTSQLSIINIGNVGAIGRTTTAPISNALKDDPGIEGSVSKQRLLNQYFPMAKIEGLPTRHADTRAADSYAIPSRFQSNGGGEPWHQLL